MTTAITEGQLAKARERGVLGFQRAATLDGDVRENHKMAHELYYSIDSPDLQWFKLPWGYNCRCRDKPITLMRALRNGWLDSNGNFVGMTRTQWEAEGARPDEGFE